MTLNKLRGLDFSQKGFTLIELLIAMAISAIILVSLGATVYQVVSVSAMDRNGMDAVKQVESALHWINRDGQQAWASMTAHVANQSFDSPLLLYWTDNEGRNHEVSYYSDPSDPGRSLQRIERIDGGVGSAINIAQHIDLAASRYSFDGQALSVRIMADIPGFRGRAEMRTLTIVPRASR